MADAQPVPPYNFVRIPVVLTDPYHYGDPAPSPVADFGSGLAVAGVPPSSPPPPGEFDPRPPL